MQLLGHRVTGGEAELGVLAQYLDGELHLVDNSLSGAVAAVEQFEVFDPIVRTDAVNVMDGFFGEKVATDVLRHDVAVFENRSRAAVSRQHGNRDPHVAVAFGMFLVPAAFKFMLRFLLLCFYLALGAAVFLFAVDSPSAAFALSCAMFFFAAILADKLVSFVRIFPTSDIGALRRAVQRVSSELFFVSSEVGLQHGKRVAAFLACEADRHAPGGRHFFVKAVGAAASETAVFSSRFYIAFIAVKRLFALLARHLDGHGYSPVCGNTGTYSHAYRGCQVDW